MREIGPVNEIDVAQEVRISLKKIQANLSRAESTYGDSRMSFSNTALAHAAYIQALTLADDKGHLWL